MKSVRTCGILFQKRTTDRSIGRLRSVQWDDDGLRFERKYLSGPMVGVVGRAMQEVHKMFSFTKKRWIAFALAVVIPLIGMGCGVVGLICDVCINCSFVITFILFPLTAALLLALCVFSRMRCIHKGVLCVIVLILFVVLCLGGMLFGSFVKLERYKNDDVIPRYTSVIQENKLMPSLDEIGQPVAMEYCDVLTIAFIFESEADHLICRYDPEEYALQKKQLEENYIFQTEILSSYVHSCEPSVEVDGYQFRVLSTEGEYEPYIDYPGRIILIGYSDEAQEIVYLSFHDTDLNYITSLTDFLNEECGWKHVR